MAKDLLMSPEEFLKSGIHIGTRYKTKGMKKYIYNQRRDGLKVLAIETISDKVKAASKLLAQYEPEEIVVVGRRVFASKAITKFCDVTGCTAKTGRFIPGTFTNTDSKTFIEPSIVLITESNLDKQAIKEAKTLNIPVISFSSTNNFTENIDLVIPANNKGGKSLATLYWLLAREFLIAKGVIKTKQDYKSRNEEFEFKGKTKAKPRDNRRGGNNRRPPQRGFARRY